MRALNAPVTKPAGMEHIVGEMLRVGAWIFAIVFIFAIIGVIATIRWIVGLVTRTERAVEGGVQSVSDRLHR